MYTGRIEIRSIERRGGLGEKKKRVQIGLIPDLATTIKKIRIIK